MNRKDFGELVAALRKDLNWKQSQLSQIANIDEPIISQIERGVKMHFEPDLLFKLANSFQLTTQERKEFFLAASGLEQSQMVRQPSLQSATDTFNARKVLDRMIEMTVQIRLPAFLCDAYGDVLVANNMILMFYKVPPAVVESAASTPGGFNTIRINFGKDMVARNQVGDNWDQYAVKSMRAFRENSLRYRGQPYFKYLMKHFRNPAEYPLFDRYWKMVSTFEEDKDSNLDYFYYHHREYGHLNYMASSITSSTSVGELYLIHNTPCDEHTKHIFDQLYATAGAGYKRLAPWPDKPIPKETV